MILTDKKAKIKEASAYAQEFSKEQIFLSDKYADKRDLVDAILDGRKKYTVETVDKMIEGFMKGKVK